MLFQRQASTFFSTEVFTDCLIQDAVIKVPSYLWIATAVIKDMFVEKGKSMVPFLQTLSKLIEDGVFIVIIQSKETGPAFRKDVDRFPNRIDRLEMILCPQAHSKTVIFDGRFAYTGSANLTCAGMGAK